MGRPLGSGIFDRGEFVQGTALNPILVAIGECHALAMRVTCIRPQSFCDPQAVSTKFGGADEMRVPIKCLDRVSIKRRCRDAVARTDICWGLAG